MPTTLQFRRGTTSQNNSFTGSVGELTVDTDVDTLRVHDGSTAGGAELVQLTATQTLTNKTLTAPNLTSPQIGGVAIAEFIADTIGAMVTSNTESGISVEYQDADNTLDFTVGTLNQNTTGNAATATALETARTIGGVSFDGTGNINLPGVNTAGNQDTSGTAAVATTVTITDNESTNENNSLIFAAGGDQDGGNLGLESDGTLTYNPSTGKVTATGFVGTLTGDVTGNVTGDVTGNADTATALATARTIGGVSFDGTGNINLPGVNTGGNQDTSGNAATATALETARTIGGVSFDGTGNINLPGVNTSGNQDTSGTAAKVTVTDSTANTNFPVVFHNESNGLLDDTGALRYNPSTGTLLVPNLSVAGTTTQVDTVTMNAQNAVVFEGATPNDFETTLTITDPTADRTITMPDATGTMALTSSDISGNAATATALETARTIGGVSFDGTGNINLPGVNTAGNQDTSGTAAIATTVTITDNESTNENNAIIFAAGGDQDGGNLGLESDGTLTYNPSTGKITATGFVGALTGDVTGNADTATALATGRTIALSGDVAATGVSFDGTGNISLTTVIQSLSVENGMIAADAVNGAKIADDAIDSEHYTDGSIDRVHLAADIVDGTKIADDSINSEHYVDGSIDTAHIADDQITEAKIADDAVGSAQLKTLSTLLIKNSAGTTLKTLHAAGA